MSEIVDIAADASLAAVLLSLVAFALTFLALSASRRRGWPLE